MTTAHFIERLENGIESYRQTKRRRLNRSPSADPTRPEPEPQPEPGPSVTTRPIMEGHDEFETTLYEIETGRPGPTAFVLGGQHGNEPAGWLAAENLLELTPDGGTLVVVPRADQKSIAEGTWGNSDFNLNRVWNAGGEPTRPLARELWTEVESYDPDVILDLHSSIGIYDEEEEGPAGKVGQAIFPTPNARPAAATVRDELNEEYLYPAGFDETWRFRLGNNQDGTFDNRKFMHKVGVETNAMGFLFETTRHETTLDQREEWTTAAAVKMLREGGMGLE